ncbi:MAG TPA: metal-sensing transcriptional repressor [Bradyrhizobium sp.]|nr:metal-sensing transcriptional repressor [Bradyrhizobium sp.]
MATQHTSHPAIVKRLKRAEGHLRAIIGMLENGRSCLDLAQQLHAVESAIANAKRELIHDHIENCLDAPATALSGKAALEELKAITRYL